MWRLCCRTVTLVNPGLQRITEGRRPHGLRQFTQTPSPANNQGALGMSHRECSPGGAEDLLKETLPFLSENEATLIFSLVSGYFLLFLFIV